MTKNICFDLLLFFCFVNIKAQVTQDWSARYNGNANYIDIPASLAVDNSGNVIVSGCGMIDFNNSNDYITVKYNPSGVQQLVKTYNGPNGSVDEPNAITVDAQGNSYVTGNSEGDYLTIRYSPAGAEQWTQRYNGPSNTTDIGISVVVDAAGKVYVTGASHDINTQEDFLTIKYTQTIGIQQISNEIPAEFSLHQNYPNPFNPNTVIIFQLTVNSFAELIVYDNLGKEITKLVNEQLQPGTYEVTFDGSNFSSGIYYYRLVTGNFKETKKMILLK